MEFLQGGSDVLERLVTETYARGLSTRDVEDCFRDATGELVISKSAVSQITDRLWEDYQAFCSRDLSGIEVEYLLLDAISESLRRHGAKEGVLAAWCVTAEGRKVLLHLAVGNGESEVCWTEFLRHMVARGLRTPTSVTCDGAPGLAGAVGAVFPQSLRIRCWYHKLGNVRQKLPEAEAEEVLAHLRLPLRHRVICRTTNLICRSFEEERRRSKVIPRFGDERQAMKLVFAVLIRAAERWSRVPMSELERAQPALLRHELGIDPPPGRERKSWGGRSSA